MNMEHIKLFKIFYKNEFEAWIFYKNEYLYKKVFINSMNIDILDFITE